MPPRQQMPFGRNSFGQQPFQQMYGMRGPGPSMMGQPRQMRGSLQRGPGKSGGLLSKILNRGGAAQTAQSQFNPLQGAAGFQRSSQAGGSFLKSITNPGALNGFLNNTQQVLKTAQQVGPMLQQFQQYGPLVKNLPAMWKLYRGLSAAETSEDEASDEKIEDEKNTDQPEGTSAKKKSKKPQISSTDNKKKKRVSGGSQPKMYI